MIKRVKKIIKGIQEDLRAWKERELRFYYVNYAIWRFDTELSIARDDLDQLSQYDGLVTGLVKRRLKRKIARLEKAHRYHQVTYEQMLEMHSHANR